jgi:hypothetical protein
MRGDKMSRKLLLIGFFLILICSFSVRTDSSDCKFCCKRRAILDNFINKHNPDFDEKQEAWIKCMNSQLNWWSTFNPDDPELKKAHENCKHLEPESWEYMYPSSVLSRLVGAFTTEYFELVTKGSQEKKPEYVFRGSYEAGLHEASGINDQLVTSRFILELYYNGYPQEHIKTWVTEKKIENPVPAHFRSMFTSSNARTRPDRPLHEMLWDFEKIPITCDINPAKDLVKPDEEISIDLTSFKDRRGRSSREFNRVGVEAKNGKILNGEESSSNPDLRVFTLRKSAIKVLFKAPESCEEAEDVIYVYNSCDILDANSVPLSETELRDKIAERVIQLDCGADWTGTVTYRRNINWTDKKTTKYHTMTSTRRLTEQASIRVPLKYTHSYETEDYFDEGTPSGSYTFSIMEQDVITDPEGLTSTQLKKASGGGPLGAMTGTGEGGAEVILVVDNTSNTYALSVYIASPECSGEYTIKGPGTAVSYPYSWTLEVDGVMIEGSVAGKTISGSWNGPSPTRGAIIGPGGMTEGATITWHFTKTGGR